MNKSKGLPIVVSAIAIIISFYSLYMSHIKPAEIDLVAGEHININYFIEGNFALTLPVSFTNNGASIAIIRRVALLIQEPGKKEGYLFEPLFYQRIDEQGNFIHDSMPVPIAVPARDSVTKQIVFRSSLDRPNEFILEKEGKYQVTLLGWIAGSVEPELGDFFSIELTDANIATLNERREQKSTSTIRIRQSKWRKWSAHHLTEFEVDALIQDKYTP